MPSWLYYDHRSNSLKGVPTPEDIKHHYIEVIGQGHGKSEAKDVFSITVASEAPTHHVPPPVSNSNGKPQVVKCKAEQPETTVTIVMDVDMNDLSAQGRLKTIQKFTDYLNLVPEMMKLLPLGGRPVIDSSALVAGPGDAKKLKTAGATISWLAGCGKMEKGHRKLLYMIESSSADGTMKKETGHPIIGWHVTYTANHLKPRRKRQVRATATPVQTPSPPTDLPDIVTEIKPSASSDPLSRTVPSMDSPSFTMTEMIKPTKTVTMPSASPTPAVTTEQMMTKVVTEAPKTTFKPKVTTEGIQPSEGPEVTTKKETTTQILPSRTFVVTDAPTMVPPTTKEPSTEKPITKEPVTKKPSTQEPMTKKPEMTTKTPVTDKPDINCPNDNNPRGPMLTGKLPKLVFPIGQETVFDIPNSLFTDCIETGGSIALSLSIFNGTLPLPETFWLRLSRRTKEWKIIGFPLPRNAGWTSFTLVAQNQFEIFPATLNIIVGVVKSELLVGEPSHKISLTFKGDYNTFSSKKLKDMTRKVAGVFSDKKDASKQITVLDVAPGSIVYSWTNNTLPTDDCPVKAVNDMVNKMVNDDGTLKMSAKRKLAPYVLNGFAAKPAGACENDPNFPVKDTSQITTQKPVKPETTPTPEPGTVSTPTPKPEPTKKPMPPKTTQPDSELQEEKQSTSDDEIWITTVVPAVVIVAILLIALIVACILYRKKRKGKMSLEDQHTFVNKGAPVIFPDEYDEKPNDSTKPLIMNDEKPPMPPPEYTRASSESSRSSDQKNEEFEEHEMDETDITSPLYRPPPPVQSPSNNKQPRPHMQPAYKNPTPYVPP